MRMRKAMKEMCGRTRISHVLEYVRDVTDSLESKSF